LGSTLYNRGDCGYAKTEIVSCPGEIACSGHGICKESPTYECMCSDGWMGTDCGEMRCSQGRAWFDYPVAADTAHTKTECSNKGACDRVKGFCACEVGFEGGACDRMSCPTDGDLPCSGHGRCMTIGKMASNSLDARGAGTSYTYGATPNDNRHWDKNTQYGCMCDAGYIGYDCTLRICPYGDDPLTRPQEDEVQSFVCTAGVGELVFEFRQKTTMTVKVGATRAELVQALESLDSISAGGLQVEYSEVVEHRTCPKNWKGGDGAAKCLQYQADHDMMCNVDGNNTVIVTFLQEHGDLPPITVTGTGPHKDKVDVDADGTGAYSRTGTKESVECSGRGLCDRNTGLCKCYAGYASSDGRGGKGDLRDCGHQKLFQELAAAE